MDLQWLYGPYEDDAEGDIECDASMVTQSVAAWHEQRQLTDERLDAHTMLDAIGEGNGYSVRWSLVKLIGEYARHNGHADIIRERIDGQKGE